MRVSRRSLGITILLALLVGLLLRSADSELTPQNPRITQGMALPEYDEEGRLRRPDGFEKWVVVGTSVGLGYSDGAQSNADNPGTFHNVYLQPEAFDHYVKTCEFPEQSVFIVTNLPSRPAKTKGPVSRTGFVAAPTEGLEVAVKDSKRFPDAWAYFLFHDAAEGRNQTVRKTEAPIARNACYDCHAEHGADDNVFTQFYSVLTSAREKELRKSKTGK
ncbi:cytochrome P460 family protein [Schlesneria sp. DSM 10557]|uniref:cytochrome P460 family protein n=1 Tax=Schlesneria sp. DSM 10557 TaxID=3044399 RepID=UPI0035A18FDD